MDIMPEMEKVKGCYWAFALGDAMGMPVEFNQIDMIKERYGEQGIQEPKSWAIWTDDTEMTFAVTNALLSLGHVDSIANKSEEEIGTAFGREFIKWFDNMGHAPGVTCKTEVYKLISKSPENWHEVGKNNSKGCGTAMRAAPLGIWFADALKPEIQHGTGKYHNLLFKVSRIQSEITHGHKAATAGSLASAYAVALAINNIAPEQMIAKIEKYCGSIHRDFEKCLNKLREALNKRDKNEYKTELDAIHSIGLGWVGEEAFSMALYSAIRAPEDLKSCLRIAVNHNGDSDSVGCIAGSILGASHGIKIVPKDWIDRLAEKKRMIDLLDRLSDFF